MVGHCYTPNGGCWPASTRCCARQQPLRLKKTNALKWNAARRRKIRERTFETKWGSGKRMASRFYEMPFLQHRQGARPQFAFAAHYVQHVNRVNFRPIEYAARRFNYLTVTAAA